ncbi:TetR/AcrR family transcriptional regulator [Nocardioides sp. AN3]
MVSVGAGQASRRVNRTGAASRERILTIAAKLFAENGYHGTGIELISSEAQLGRGALYHHIGNKEALLFEICHSTISDLLRDSEVVLARGGSAIDRFRGLMEVGMTSIASRLPEWRVSLHDFGALTGERREIIREGRDRWERMVADVLVQGAEAGELRRLDPIVTKGVIGMFNYSIVWISPEGSISPSRIAEKFCDAILGGIAHPEG